MGVKGKTTFELTDVNTGKVEKYEDCNMITNGLQEFLDPCGSWGIYPFAVDDVRKKAVRNTLTGGIFLFDSALDENVANTYAGADVKMVGNGALGISNSSAVTELGSYNSTESGVQSDGSIKYVYDFTTAQANGTIRSACLTSKVGGYMGYGNESGKSVYATSTSADNYLVNTKYQNNVYKYLSMLYYNGYYYMTFAMYAMYEEDALYVIEPSSIFGELSWKKTKKIRVVKYRLGVKSVGLNDYDYLNNLIASYDVSVPQDILDYMGASIDYVSAVADAHTREIFIVFTKSGSVSNGSFFWVMRIDKDMQATAHKVVNNTGYSIYDISNKQYYNNFAVDNGYFWCWLKKGNNYNLVGIKYTDSTQIIETDVVVSQDLGLTKTYDHLLEYGRINVSSSVKNNRNVFNTLTKKFFSINGNVFNADYSGYYKVLFADKKGLYLCCNHSSSFYLIKDPRYLATINNLTEPVVKTASKTMKVTYTLTQEGDA